MSDRNLTVAIYETHDQAEQAVKELQKSGFDMKQLSIVGKGYETENHVIGYYNAGDRMKHWGKFGAFWGGIWGLLFGAAFFLIPGIGPVLVAGPIPGMRKKAAPNSSPHRPPQNAPNLPQCLIRSPAL